MIDLYEIIRIDGEQEMLDKTRDNFEKKFGCRDYYAFTVVKPLYEPDSDHWQTSGLIAFKHLDFYYTPMVGKSQDFPDRPLYIIKPEYRMLGEQNE